MKNYFRGWYYRCQSDTQTLAIIPSIHKTLNNAFCNIQIITDSNTFQTSFPYSDLNRNIREICIGKNRFGNNEIVMDIQTPELQASGDLRFGTFTPTDIQITTRSPDSSFVTRAPQNKKDHPRGDLSHLLYWESNPSKCHWSVDDGCHHQNL